MLGDRLKNLPHWRSPRLKMAAISCPCLRIRNDMYHLSLEPQSPWVDHAPAGPAGPPHTQGQIFSGDGKPFRLYRSLSISQLCGSPIIPSYLHLETDIPSSLGELASPKGKGWNLFLPSGSKLACLARWLGTVTVPDCQKYGLLCSDLSCV